MARPMTPTAVAGCHVDAGVRAELTGRSRRRPPTRFERRVDDMARCQGRLEAAHAQRHNLEGQRIGRGTGGPQQAAGAAIDTCRLAHLGCRSRFGVGENEFGIPGGQHHAQPVREGGGVIGLGDPARSQQDVVGGDAAVPRLGLRSLQRRRIDQRAYQERVLVPGRRRPGMGACPLSGAPHPR
jgi:hypothetical protein